MWYLTVIWNIHDMAVNLANSVPPLQWFMTRILYAPVCATLFTSIYQNSCLVRLHFFSYLVMRTMLVLVVARHLEIRPTTVNAFYFTFKSFHMVIILQHSNSRGKNINGYFVTVIWDVHDIAVNRADSMPLI